MKTFSILAGLGCLAILFWVVAIGVIALPISLVVGFLWNILSPTTGLAPWDGVTAYAITLLVMIGGSMIGKS